MTPRTPMTEAEPDGSPRPDEPHVHWAAWNHVEQRWAEARANSDPWAATGDGLTPDERLSLAHANGIEVGRAEARAPLEGEIARLREILGYIGDWTKGEPTMAGERFPNMLNRERIHKAVRAALEGSE
jgi:hypothetical protein